MTAGGRAGLRRSRWGDRGRGGGRLAATGVGVRRELRAPFRNGGIAVGYFLALLVLLYALPFALTSE